MDLQAFWLSVQATDLSTSIRESTLAYPIILASHLTTMGLFGGMILMTDLRILGIAMKDRPMADVHNQLRPLKHLGLTMAVTFGFLMAFSKIAIYWPNPYFKLKLTMLLCVAIHALVFRGSVYKKLADFDKSGIVPGNAKVAAIISLLMWITLVTAGRWIGYWEAPTT